MVSISVVIPTFNRADSLLFSINSILNQTLRPLEIIIVDDGSTDSTSSIINSNFEFTHIKYVYQSNAGAGAARNLGVQLAKGEWIAFLDSDDVWQPKKLEHFCEVLASSPEIDFYYTPSCAMQQPVERLNLTDQDLEQRRNKFFLLKSFLTRTPTVMVRKELTRFPGVAFGGRRTCEDYAFFWRAIILARQIGFSPCCDTLVRESENSLRTSSTFMRIAEDQLMTIREVIDWIDANRLEPTFKNPLKELFFWQWKNLLAYDVLEYDWSSLYRHVQMNLLDESVLFRVRKICGATKLVISRDQRKWLRKYATF